MTPVEVRFTLTAREVAAAAFYELGRSGLLRRQRITFAVLGVVLLTCAAAGFAALVAYNSYGWWAFATLCTGLGLLLTSSAASLPAQQLKGLTKLYAGPRYRNAGFGPVVVCCRREGVSAEWSYGRVDLNWPTVTEAGHDSGHVYIAGSFSALAIPRTAFPDDEAVRAFVETILSEIARTRPQ